MKKTLQTVAMSLIVISLIGCGKIEEGGMGKETKINPKIEVANISNDEDYTKFYQNYYTKLQDIIEKDDKYYIYSIDGDEIYVDKVINNNDNMLINIELMNHENQVNLQLYSYKKDGVDVDEINTDIINIIDEYFGYGLNVEDVKKKLKETKEFYVNDEAAFSMLDDGAILFSGEVLAKIDNMEIKDHKPTVTLEYAKSHDIWKNGKADKIFERFEKSKTGYEPFADDEKLTMFDIELGDSMGEFSYDYENTFIEEERMFTKHTIGMLTGEDYGNLDEVIESKLKPLFDIIYDDTKLFDELVEKLKIAPDDKKDEGVVRFTPDEFARINVRIERRVISERTESYEIEIEHNFKIKQ